MRGNRLGLVVSLALLATIYHNMGIAPHAFLQDKADRPVAILASTAEPIHELV
jgi:hypothetical protein